MMGLGKYYVTGYSARFGMWMCEVIEAATMEAAKNRYAVSNPTLRNIRAYRLRDVTRTTEHNTETSN
jgi:hypothetical protein